MMIGKTHIKQKDEEMMMMMKRTIEKERERNPFLLKKNPIISSPHNLTCNDEGRKAF